MTRSNPWDGFLHELRWMGPLAAVVALAGATVLWANGDSFWVSLALFVAGYVFVLPLIWARWFLTGGSLWSRRGLFTFGVCVAWAAVGVAIAILLS
jgi:hypothetical protein